MPDRSPRPTGLVLALVTAALPLGAQPLTARVWARGAHDGALRPGPVQARRGETVTLAAQLVDRAGRPVPLPAGATVRWLQVLPRPYHTEHAPPNPGVRSFSNAGLYGARHGRWLGYDRLEYDTLPLAASPDHRPEGPVLRVTAARPPIAERDRHDGVGSSWFSAEIVLPDGRVVRSPDGADLDRLGLVPAVARVSFRRDDSYLGWLGTYFHVASVFGSNGPTDAEHQSDRYTGADCANVLVGALRAAGRRDAAYTSVAGIGRLAVARSAVLRALPDGTLRGAEGAAVALRWGDAVAPGDLVTLDYASDTGNLLPRAWDHIAALVSDANGDGVLDGGDLVRHMGPEGLVDTPLVHAGPMRVVLWRWRATPTPRGDAARRPASADAARTRPHPAPAARAPGPRSARPRG